MKTLDEVIKAWSICFSDNSRSNCTGCPYADEDGEAACFNHDREDSLHYLKEYRSDKAMWEVDRKGYLDWIEQYKESREKHQQAVIELKKNPPLTWDELRQMEGKPVWIEYGCDFNQKRWVIIHSFHNTGSFCYMNVSGNYPNTFLQKDMGEDEFWQAYRKERE